MTHTIYLNVDKRENIIKHSILIFISLILIKKTKN